VPATSQPSPDDVVDAWLKIVDAAVRTHHRLLEKVSQAGVSDQWFGVLHLLLRAEDHRMPMTRLARDLSMTAGGFTKLADRMGREGLIDRRGSSGDRRVVYATLTEEGLEQARRSEEAFQDAVKEVILGQLNGKALLGVAENLARLGHTVPPAPTEEPPPSVTERDPNLPDRRRAGESDAEPDADPER
jgi:DNA-binding MarR family transcriptional regulator